MFDFNKVVEEREKDEDPGSGAVAIKPKEFLARFEEHKAQLATMQDRAKTLEVKDQGSAELATTWGVEAARLAKEIETKEKELIEEPNRFVKAVKAAAKRYLDPLEDLKNLLRAKIRDYQTRVELERRKTEELAKKATEEIQSKINAEAKSAGVQAPILPPPIIPPAKPTVKGEEGGSSSQRTVWLFEVTDKEKIPRQFLKLDEVCVRAAIKMGNREIPGLRIWEEKTTVFRT